MPATPTTACARRRTGRSRSFASARSSSCSAADSRTRARPHAAPRSSRSRASPERIPGDVNAFRPLLHDLAARDPNVAVRRLAVVCLRNGTPQRDTIQILDGIADDDEEDAELRKAARTVSAQLLKKSRAK